MDRSCLAMVFLDLPRRLPSFPAFVGTSGVYITGTETVKQRSWGHTGEQGDGTELSCHRMKADLTACGQSASTR